MTSILKKLEDLRVHSDLARTNELQTRVGSMDRAQLDSLHVGSQKTGHVVLLDSPGEPNCVLEMSICPTGGDSVGTLFHAHPIFNSRQDYVEARQELIEIIEDIANADHRGVAVHCPVRNRPTNVRNLGIQQMLDIVRFRVAQAGLDIQT